MFCELVREGCSDCGEPIKTVEPILPLEVLFCCSLGQFCSPQFLLRRLHVVVKEIAQEKERQHVVSETIGEHCASKLVGDVPKSLSELLLGELGHEGDVGLGEVEEAEAFV